MDSSRPAPLVSPVSYTLDRITSPPKFQLAPLDDINTSKFLFKFFNLTDHYTGKQCLVCLSTKKSKNGDVYISLGVKRNFRICKKIHFVDDYAEMIRKLNICV